MLFMGLIKVVLIVLILQLATVHSLAVCEFNFSEPLVNGARHFLG